jgi:hypothetical protein
VVKKYDENNAGEFGEKVDGDNAIGDKPEGDAKPGFGIPPNSRPI